MNLAEQADPELPDPLLVASASGSTTKSGAFDLDRKPGLRLMLMLIGCSASVAFFFRYQIGNGFTLLFADRYDGLIELAIVQHWYNALHGLSGWATTNYFYPAGTLGYNDGYMLYGFIYSVWRALGFDPFISNELVSMTLKTIGFTFTYVAARRILGLHSGWSILISILFTTSNNLFIRSFHAQLFGVCIAPLIATLLYRAVISLKSPGHWPLFVWGAAASLAYSIWLLSTFYMAWFFCFFCVFLSAAWLLLTPADHRRMFLAALRYHLVPLVGLAALTLAINFPFLSVYLPAARETGQHTWDEVSIHTISIFDLFNVGSGNWLFGDLLKRFNHLVRPNFPDYGERTTGFPPFLLLLFASGVIWLFWRRNVHCSDRYIFMRALALATIVSWGMALHIRSFTPWFWIYTYFPGAAAARVVARYQIFLGLPVIGIAVFFLSRFDFRARPVRLLMVCGLLLLEEVNVAAPLAIHRPQELARLAAVPVPPAQCKAFFSYSDRGEPLYGPSLDQVYSHNVDAMLIAELIDLPTVNGMSTFVPKGWDLAFQAPDYRNRVRTFAEHHGVRQLCGLDLRTLRWELNPFRSGTGG